MYFDQERLYNRITFGITTLGAEKYLRILAVALIFLTVIISLLVNRAKYHFSIYFAYLTLLIYVSLNYIISGADLANMTQFMDTKGIGTWVCLGLIFVSHNDKRFESFKKFLFFSVLFITTLSIINMLQFGVGLWRGQAMGKYQIYAVNLVWIAPYVFLILKNNSRLKWLRVFSLIIGVVLALIIQTRSFLLIYVITLLFDFYHTKNKRTYVILIALGFVGFAYLVLKTEILSTSYELLVSRGLEDTRLGQLDTFISQLNITELITGGGFFVSYLSGKGQYSYVDNQWLYLIWWGGLIPTLAYFYLGAVIPLKMLFKSGLDYETRVECFVLIIWVLALFGLAIFSTMSVNFYFFIVSIILGRVLYKYRSSSR